jgi:hypothetical protein
MQERGVEQSSALDRAGPESLDDVPCLAEAGWVVRANLDPVGVPPVELGTDKGRDVDPLIVTLSRSPLISTFIISTPRMATPIRSTARNWRW